MRESGQIGWGVAGILFVVMMLDKCRHETRITLEEDSPFPHIIVDGKDCPLYYRDTGSGDDASKAWGYMKDGKWVWLNIDHDRYD